jgi:sulfonate transport system ATP-binding protein
MQVDLPRPRARGNAAFAALEQRLLGRILKQAPAGTDIAAAA